MRYSLLVLLLVLLIISCKAPYFFIGMNEQAFLSKNKGVKIVKSSKSETIYQKINYPFGKPPDYKFFYFINGQLDHVDEGVQSPDLIIQHNRN